MKTIPSCKPFLAEGKHDKTDTHAVKDMGTAIETS